MSTALLIAATAAAGCAAVLVGDRPVRRLRPGNRRSPAGRVGGPPGIRLWRRLRPGPPAPVADLLAALAAELAAGQPTATALVQASAGLHPAPCPHATRAARTGGDVVEALGRDAVGPAAEGLRGLAACWQVAERSGAGLALAVDRLGEGLRASEQARAQLRSELAAVHSTARLLAGLPLFGLLIGQWIGADPGHWLVGSWPGRLALLLGAGLQLAGLAWLRRLVASARAGL